MIAQTLIFAVLLLIMWTIVILLVWQDGREKKKGTAMKDNDLISRSALLGAFENNIDTDVCQECADYQYLWGFSWETVERAIQEAPAVDAVEVVRCKNCKHFCPYEGEEHKGDCDELVGLESCVYEDDFCSYGERRADDATD